MKTETAPSNTTKHTPTPWRLVERNEKHFQILTDTKSQVLQKWEADNGKETTWGNVEVCELHGLYNGSGPKHGPDMIYGTDEAKANAAFIVRAVNAHDKLVSALERLVQDVECYCADNTAYRGPCGSCEAKAALYQSERPAMRPPSPKAQTKQAPRLTGTKLLYGCISSGRSTIDAELRAIYEVNAVGIESEALGPELFHRFNCHDELVAALENTLWKANQKQPLSNDDKNNINALLSRTRA